MTDNLSDRTVETLKKLVELLPNSEEIDAFGLLILADLMATRDIANEHIAEEGMILTTPKGYPMVSNWLAIKRKAEQQAVKLLQQYGCTPASRAKLVDKIEETDTLEDFIKGKEQGNA
jgi:P27 family predicted phage terminase small subunit